MSVILTGMDMQESCDSCDLYVLDRNGFPYCAKTKQFIFNGKIHNEDCPMKSVDGLIEQIEQSKHQRSLSDDNLTFYQDGLDDAIAIIKEYCRMEPQ